MPRPGPLSKKKPVIYQKRDSLGDSSEGTPSSSDEPTANRSATQRSAEKENRSPASGRQSLRQSQRLGRPSEGRFLTPEKEVNATDYGLEFTTSNIQNPSPRRCSTLRTMSSQEEQESSAGLRSARQERHKALPSTSKEARKELSKSMRGRPKKKSMARNENDENSVEEEEAEDSSRSQDEEEQPTRRTLREANANKSPEKKGGKRSTLASDVRRLEPKSVQKPAKENQPSMAQQSTTAKAKNKQKSRKQKNPLQYKLIKERQFLREVKHLQNRLDYLIPRLPFSRVIREIMQMCTTEVHFITPSALEAIQAASEMYLTQRLQDAYMLTLHRGRVTLEVRDMQLINYLKLNL